MCGWSIHLRVRAYEENGSGFYCIISEREKPGLGLHPLTCFCRTSYLGRVAHAHGLAAALFSAPEVFSVWVASILLVTICAKWSLVGRYRPGAYPLWGLYFIRWWIVDRLAKSCQVLIHYIVGTPVLEWYLKFMGAHVGKGVTIKTVYISDFDLINIGDGSVIGEVSSELCVSPSALFVTLSFQVGRPLLTTTSDVYRRMLCSPGIPLNAAS